MIQNAIDQDSNTIPPFDQLQQSDFASHLPQSEHGTGTFNSIMVSHLAIVGSPYVGNGISSELITWHQWIWTNSIVHIIVLTSWIAMAQIITCDLGWLISPFRSTSGHCPNLIATGLRRMRDRLTTNAPFRYTAVFLGYGPSLNLDPAKNHKKPSKTIKNL